MPEHECAAAPTRLRETPIDSRRASSSSGLELIPGKGARGVGGGPGEQRVWGRCGPDLGMVEWRVGKKAGAINAAAITLGISPTQTTFDSRAALQEAARPLAAGMSV